MAPNCSDLRQENLPHKIRAKNNYLAWMYVAHPSTIDKSLKPYGWYLEFVIQGAYQHRLPLCYIADLHRIELTVDPDPTRDEANRRLLVGNTRR